jgi:hypothetical protein
MEPNFAVSSHHAFGIFHLDLSSGGLMTSKVFGYPFSSVFLVAEGIKFRRNISEIKDCGVQE